MVFSGNIVNAWGEYKGLPDVYLQIQAQSAYYNQVKLVNPRSYKGQISVSTIIDQIAKDMGFDFQDNLKNIINLNNVYIYNTDVEQLKELAKTANIDLYVDDDVIAICNKYQPRILKIPTINAKTGLMSYPTFDGVGVTFQTLYNSLIKFGGNVQLESDVLKASGKWLVITINHRFESENPNGAWFSTVRGILNGVAI